MVLISLVATTTNQLFTANMYVYRNILLALMDNREPKYYKNGWNTNKNKI